MASFYWAALFWFLAFEFSVSTASVPKIVVFNSGGKQVLEHSRVVLLCTIVSGSKPIQLSWFVGERAVNTEYSIVKIKVDEDVSTLLLPNVSRTDSGEYTCKAENQLGSDRFSLRVDVQEPKFSTRVQNVGSRFKMLCAPQFGDQLRFSWSRNGRPLSLSDSTDDYQHYQIESGQFESSLTIAQVTAKDTGSNFTCTAANQLGMDTMTVLLSVNAPFPSHRSANVGSRFKILCQVEEGTRERLIFQWTKNGKEVQSTFNDDHRRIIETAKDESTLTIDHLQPSDGGNYKQSAEQVDSEGLLFEWLKNGSHQPLISNSHLKIESGDDESSLTIFKLIPEDSGNYSCVHPQLPNQIQKLSKLVAANGNFCATLRKVLVHFGLPGRKMQSQLSISRLEVHDAGNYSCNVENDFGADRASTLLVVQEGDRPFRFEWRKDGHRLLPSDRHRIEAVEDDSLLIIDHLKSSDGGNYSCKVENSAGSDLQWTQLLLKGDED
ncbi:hypothetical protein TYRP_004114, partial [Tyrophagus putrescentiae]